MKILITGSDGFIGQELIASLQHHQIIPYTHKEDILNYQRLKESMQGCQAVIHLAAIKKPLEDKTFKDYWETNCQGTFNVAQACLETGVKKLIFTSSMTYYGMERGMPFQPPIKENSTILTQRTNAEGLTPENRDCDVAYSTSKVIGEQLLANYGMRKKFQVIILRLGPTRPKGIYKPFGDLKLHLKIENAIQAIVNSLDADLWYEAFTIADDNIKGVPITKAKKLLKYKPI